MDALKTLWALSFRGKTATDMVISILIYIVIGVVAGLLAWVIGIVPLFGWILAWLIRVVVGLYTLAGIIFAILYFANVME